MAAEYLRPVRQGIVTAHARAAAVAERELEGRTQLCDEEEWPVLDFKATFKIARDARIRDIAFGDTTAETKP